MNNMRRSLLNPRPVRGLPVFNFIGGVCFLLLCVVFVVAGVRTVALNFTNPVLTTPPVAKHAQP